MPEALLQETTNSINTFIHHTVHTNCIDSLMLTWRQYSSENRSVFSHEAVRNSWAVAVKHAAEDNVIRNIYSWNNTNSNL